MKPSIPWAVVGVDWSDEVARYDPGALEDYTVDSSGVRLRQTERPFINDQALTA